MSSQVFLTVFYKDAQSPALPNRLKLVSVLFLVLSLCHVHPAEVCEWGSEEINTWVRKRGGEVR